MATRAKDGSDGDDAGGAPAESGPLRGGEPVDPRHRDPHPTDEAEQRSKDVQSGRHSGEKPKTDKEGKD